MKKLKSKEAFVRRCSVMQDEGIYEMGSAGTKTLLVWSYLKAEEQSSISTVYW